VAGVWRMSAMIILPALVIVVVVATAIIETFWKIK